MGLFSAAGPSPNPFGPFMNREEMDADRAEVFGLEGEGNSNGRLVVHDGVLKDRVNDRHRPISVKEAVKRLADADKSSTIHNSDNEYLRRFAGGTNGRDRPDKRELTAPNGEDVCTKRPVRICLRDVFPNGQPNKPIWIGQFKQKQGSSAPKIQLSWFLNSQAPGLKLHIVPPEGAGLPKEIIYSIPCQAIVRRDNGGEVKILFRAGRHPDILGSLKSGSEIVELAEQNHLMEVEVLFWSPNDLLTGANPVTMRLGRELSRPSWTGISAKKLADILDRYRSWAVDVNDEVALNETERVMGMLDQANNLSVYRRLTRDCAETADVLFKWAESAFHLTAHSREMWYYQLRYSELTGSLNASVFGKLAKIGLIEPPRWLAKDFMADFNDRNEIVRAVPYMLDIFAFSENEVCWPNSETLGFAFRMGIERGRQLQSDILNSMFQRGDFEICGTFRSHPRRPGFYIVGLWVSEGKLVNADRSMHPKGETRLEMDVDVGLGRSKSVKYTGVTCDDLFSIHIEYTVMVNGADLKLYNAKFTDGAEGENDFFVNVRLIDDPTPANRHRDAIREIEEGLYERENGVDIPYLVLRGPPTIVNTGSLMDGITKHLGLDCINGIIDRVCTLFSLNTKQVESVRNYFSTDCGLLLVYGPPGTGKSWLDAAIVIVIGAINRRLPVEMRSPALITAPTNTATQSVMERFVTMCTIIESGPAEHHDLLPLSQTILWKGAMIR